MDSSTNPRGILALFTSAHITNHMFIVVFPALLPVFKTLYGLDYFESGVLVAVFFAGLLFQILIGFASDKTGKRKIFAGGGLILASLLTLTITLAPNYLILLGIALLMGVAASTYHPPGIALVSEAYPMNHRGRALGIHAIGEAGMAVSPFIIGVTALTLPWEFSIYIISGIGLAVGIVYLIFVSEPPKRAIEKVSNQIGKRKNGLMPFIIPVLIASFALILGTMAFMGVMNFLTLYLTGVFQTTFAFSALILGLMPISAVISAPLGGLVSDKIGRKWVILISLISLGILIFLFTNLTLGLAMYIVLFLMGFFTFFKLPALHAYIADVTPTQHRGSLYAIFLTTSSGFEGLAPIVVGSLIDFSGFRFSFTVLAVLAFVGVAIGLFIRKR
ncbi:MAG: MFS transporter [Candidatus Bathyarchaeota archaeon]